MASKPKAPAKTAAKKIANPSLKLTEFSGVAVADAVAASGAKKSGALYRVPVGNIVEIPGFNLRITDTDPYRAGIEDLKQSILLEGFYDSKPLSVFAAEVDGANAVVLIDGHRRFEALKAAIAEGADIELVPVVFKKPTATDLDLAISLQKENAHAPLSMFERAVLAHRMLKSGEDVAGVAARLNVSERHVNDLTVLIAAPKAVRDLIKDGKISASEAVIQLRKEGGAEKILEAAAKAAERSAAKDADKAGKQDARLTRSTIEEGGGEPRPKMVIYRANFQVAEGAEFAYEDAEPFLRLIGEETWYKKARKHANRIALEPVSVEVKVRRLKTAEDETEAEAEPEPAPRKGGRKAAAPEPELDAGLDDDFDGEAPNLRELGVADPADAGL